MIKEIMIDNKLKEVEFDYEIDTTSFLQKRVYTLYYIDGIPEHFYTEEFKTLVTNKLEELRNEEEIW